MFDSDYRYDCTSYLKRFRHCSDEQIDRAIYTAWCNYEYGVRWEWREFCLQLIADATYERERRRIIREHPRGNYDQ